MMLCALFILPSHCCCVAILKPHFSTFHPFQWPSFTAIPLPSLHSLSVPPPKSAGAPEEINHPSVNVTLSQARGGGGREMRVEELPLRDATPCSALLCCGVVMEELRQRQVGEEEKVAVWGGWGV